jgi:septation ring formation regulator EzrA
MSKQLTALDLDRMNDPLYLAQEQIKSLTRRLLNAQEFLNTANHTNEIKSRELATLKSKLAERDQDAEVGWAIRHLPERYTITNDGLILHQWEITEWLKEDHRHFNEATLRDTLIAAGLLKGGIE